VLGEGARLVLIGLLIGAPGIYFASGLIQGILVGVSPLDPLTLVAVALGLALVAMAACCVRGKRPYRADGKMTGSAALLPFPEYYLRTPICGYLVARTST
jgi:hypothetical protein